MRNEIGTSFYMYSKVRAIIKGDVQGVGYRWFVERMAAAAGIDGWVRNLSDGNVEVEAEGLKEVLVNFLETLKTGHSSAYVSEIETEWTPVKDVKTAGGFRIRF